MQKLLASLLDALGVRDIHIASEGKQGFDMFCEHCPDIVLLDWHMAPVCGMEMLNCIRNNRDSPNRMVPVIMMTGYSALEKVHEARDTGVTEFLVKPFSSRDLARRIAYVINKPRDFIQCEDYFGPDRRRSKIKNYMGPMRRDDDADNLVFI